MESLDLSPPSGILFGYKNDGFFSSFKNCKNRNLLPFYSNEFPSDYEVCEF